MNTPCGDAKGVLAGCLVVDFTQAIAGPFATRVLGELGARVVKVESFKGDFVRGVQRRPGALWGPMFGHGSGGKESLCVDWHTPEGHRIVDLLLDRADIIVENFRPGTMERAGFDPKALIERPRHPIVCSISGFGRGSPYSGWSATDPMGQAVSGMTYMIGERGRKPFLAANGIADSSTAMNAVVGILAALIGREKDGRGRYIDLSMAETMLAMDCVNNPVAAAYPDVDFEPIGYDHPAVCPFGLFATRDGLVVIQAMGSGADSGWGRLCGVLGRTDLITDDRTATEAARLQNRELVNSEIEAWVGKLGRDDAIARLQDAGVIIGPVLSPREAVDHPLFAARRCVRQVPADATKDGPGLAMVALPFASAGLTDAPRRPPQLGEHTRRVLRELLGIDDDEIDRLHAEDVVRTSDQWS